MDYRIYQHKKTKFREPYHELLALDRLMEDACFNTNEWKWLSWRRKVLVQRISKPTVRQKIAGIRRGRLPGELQKQVDEQEAMDKWSKRMDEILRLW